MTEKPLPKKKPSVWIGLALTLAAIVVVGYFWYGQDHESQVGPEQRKRAVREKTIRKGDYVSSPREQMRRSSDEKSVQYSHQGGKPDDRGKRDAVRNGSLFTVAPDDESGKFTERDMSARYAQSKVVDSDQGTVPINPDAPDYSDAAPPSVKAIRFDPQKVSPGAKVSVHVEATDNLSGVNSISGMVRSPSGTAVLSFACQRSDHEGSFVGTLAIPDRAEMGPWDLTRLRITDKAHNSRTYSEESALLRNSYFEVTGSDSDGVPPKVTAVYLNPSEAYGGDRVQVTVEAEDDKSGVARISGVLMSPSKHARLSFSCQNEGETNMFYGNITVPEDAESGYWTLEYLRPIDEAKNTKTFYRKDYPSIFDDAGLHVYSSSADSQPPTLDNLMIYPASVAYEETVEIIVYASDDTSGISRISGGLRSPSGKARIPFSCVYDQENQEYKAKVLIPTNAEIGLWRVDYIRMTDNARNQINYTYHADSLVQQAVLEITGQ
ncbi:MAG: hypothetical protein JRF64_03545 [Deltaproteobacteria bacterium]|nr:hypothetical protein [Deltaproteobacteria bacterium]